MANKVTVFVDPDGTYDAPYTSNVIETRQNESSNAEKGIFQADVTSGTGNVALQMRLAEEAVWTTYKIYTVDTVEEVPLARYMRVNVTTGGTGNVKCYLQEIE